MPTVNIVPRDRVSLDRLREIAASYGWSLDQDSLVTARNAETSPEYVWHAGNGSVTLVQDSLLKGDFLTIDAPDPQPLVDRLAGDIACYTLAEIIETLTAARSREERISALRLLAAAAPGNTDQSILGLIRENLEQPEPRIRLAAITAARRLRWRDLRAVIENVAATDDQMSGAAQRALYLAIWDRG